MVRPARDGLGRDAPARSATLHEEWRIRDVPPGQRGAHRRAVLMSEQLMLPSGLYVEKSTEQPAPRGDSRGPAQGGGDRGDFDGDVTRPHRGEQEPALRLP